MAIRENALEPTLAQFEEYDGGILQAHGWIILPTWEIREKKFHPVRYYVVDKEEARILISHATATWLGLVKVLCPNKAPKIKWQVAFVSKKVKEPPESNNNNFLSGLQHPPKVKYFIIAPSQSTILSNGYSLNSNKMKDQLHSHVATGGDITEAKGGRWASGPSACKISFQVDGNKAMRVQSSQSMSPCSTTKPSQSTIKSSSNNCYCSAYSRATTPSQSEISGFCQNVSMQVTGRPQNLHQPGSIKVSSVRDLLRLYPNSFGPSLKGEYDIKVDPTVPPV